MLWDRLSQLREILSLVFCIGFSLTSLIWNSNLVVKTVASSQIVSNTISSSLDSFGSFFKSAYNKLESYESLRKERDSYAKLIEEYKILPQDINNLKAENEALRREIGFKSRVEYPTIKAEVLSVRLNSIYRTIIINKGKEAGIRPYMPVIGRAIDDSTGQVIQALAGKVIAVNNGSSVVQPLINSNFTMGVQIPNANLWAVLSGNSGKTTDVILNYIDSAIIINPRLLNGGLIGPQLPSDVKGFTDSFGSIGKVVYSSAGGGLFPPGIPVGMITEEGPRSGSFKTAYVRPFVKFTELQYVSVIKKLPDKWVEDWPEEKSVVIDNPYFGELNFPGEILEGKDTTKDSPAPPIAKEEKKKTPIIKPDEKKIETKTAPAKTPVKEVKKAKPEDDLEDMMKKLESPQ